jgi:hypothetical protein
MEERNCDMSRCASKPPWCWNGEKADDWRWVGILLNKKKQAKIMRQE